MSYVNGKEYAANEITITAWGAQLDGVVSFNWDDSSSVSLNHAIGSSKAVSYTEGTTEVSGSMEILETLYVQLCKSLPTGKTLKDVNPTDIRIVKSPNESTKLAREVIEGVKIEKISGSIQKGANVVRKLDFKACGVNPNPQ